jgi:hypothetical protein
LKRKIVERSMVKRSVKYEYGRVDVVRGAWSGERLRGEVWF